MTTNVNCCQASDSIQKAAQVMKSADCGSVPVCESKKVVGIVTDRDICIHAIAEGNFTAKVSECMSTKVVTCQPETDAHEAADMMARFQVRRLPVVDASGNLVGICAMADLATVDIHVNEAGDALSRISQPSDSPNAVH